MRSIGVTTLLLLGGLWAGSAIATSPPRPSPPSTAPATPAPAAPGEWKQWYGGWVRLEAAEGDQPRNLSCLSLDGKNCVWNKSVVDPTTYAAHQLTPLVCGAGHAKHWEGRTGYNDRDNKSGDHHWCRAAYATLFAKWKDYSDLGVKHWLSETPAGDVMCHSTDSRTCTQVLPGESRPPVVAEINPLVCGTHHRRMHSDNDGYGQPGHWCRTPKIDEDFGTREATGDWTQIKAKGWAYAIEPAMLVRAKVPAGRSLTLRTKALAKDSLGDETQKPREVLFGIEFGKQLGFHLDGVNRGLAPFLTTMAPSTGQVMVGMTVTPKGNACFFGTDGGTQRKGPFFAKENLLGNTEGTFDQEGRPMRFLASSAKWRNELSLVEWLADAGPSFKIDKVLMLYARLVPVEGDTTGKQKRWIHYADTCDPQ